MTDVGLDRICVALDRATAADNIALVEQLAGHATWFKVGLRQYYQPGGPDVIAAVRAANARLFLDLKLHDIPKTVGDAAAALLPHAPDLVTVHGTGGSDMVAAAVNALAPSGGVLAVTILTSLDTADLAAVWGEGLDATLSTTVTRIASLSVGAGARGIVCSALEVETLRTALGPAPLLVTPGIRPRDAAAGDQKRVMTPGRAIAAGSSLLVVGRPIYEAADPLAALQAIAAEDVQ